MNYFKQIKIFNNLKKIKKLIKTNQIKSKIKLIHPFRKIKL